MQDYSDSMRRDIDSLSDLSQIPVDSSWRPSDDFVICRDAGGLPTAVYGEEVWDLNPIRLGAKNIDIIRFDLGLEVDSSDAATLIAEVKYLVFCLMFYVTAGQLGRLSARVIVGYALALRAAAEFCYSQKCNPLIGQLSLAQLFSTPAYVNSYRCWMDANNATNRLRLNTRTLILHLADVGEPRLGFAINGVFGEDFGGTRSARNQTPIIPTRIFLGIINDLGDFLDLVHSYKDRLEAFILFFDDPYYGRNEEQQIKKLGLNGSSVRPTLDQAIKSHGLEQLFSGDLQPKGIGSAGYRSGLTAVIMRIQYALKIIIHLYTGMRDEEALRLPYNCIDSESLTHSVDDDKGVVRDPAMMVNVISTTTKFAGYRKETAWLATESVVRAVEVAQAICRGLSHLYNIDCRKVPLFLSPIVINKPKSQVGVCYFHEGHRPDLLLKYSIQETDLAELEASDPSRNFAVDECFQVGATWRFATHQFRRSLAFYGSSSGFISLPSLRKQFKHLTTQMTRYYANNFDKLKTIFGYYDEEKQDFVLPKNHFLFEYQTGVPLNIAYELLDHAFGDGSVLFGGVGTYISNQREKMGSGDIDIAELRSETEKQAKEGKIAYRATLLGGCTTVGKCDSYLLGNAVSCLSCDEGIIDKEKLESAIADDEALLERLEPGTGEYQVVESELNGFRAFHQKFISVRVVE